MKLIITSCFVQNPFCAPVVFVNDFADPAPQPVQARSEMFSHPEMRVQDSVCEADGLCCTVCLRKALLRLVSAHSNSVKRNCAPPPQRPASRKMKQARSARKRARAQRLQVRTGALPACLKRPRAFRLSPAASEADAPYPLDTHAFKASLAQAMDALKAVPSESGVAPLNGHGNDQEADQGKGGLIRSDKKCRK
jgi:hypothetical protein